MIRPTISDSGGGVRRLSSAHVYQNQQVQQQRRLSDQVERRPYQNCDFFTTIHDSSPEIQSSQQPFAYPQAAMFDMRPRGSFDAPSLPMERGFTFVSMSLLFKLQSSPAKKLSFYKRASIGKEFRTRNSFYRE